MWAVIFDKYSKVLVALPRLYNLDNWKCVHLHSLHSSTCLRLLTHLTHPHHFALKLYVCPHASHFLPSVINFVSFNVTISNLVPNILLISENWESFFLWNLINNISKYQNTILLIWFVHFRLCEIIFISECRHQFSIPARVFILDLWCWVLI